MAELRGAPATAAELLELAVSVTPGDAADDARRRRVSAGRLLALAGETRAAQAIWNDLAAGMPPGPKRAEVLAHLGWNSEDDFDAATRLLEQALAEAGDAPALCANIHLFLSDKWAAIGDIERSAAESHLAIPHAKRAGDPLLLASALAQDCYWSWASGREVDPRQLDRALALEHDLESVGNLAPPSEALGLCLMGTGRLDEARAAFDRALGRAEAEGVEYVRADVLLRLSGIATRTGDPRRGAELAQAGLEIAERVDRGQLTSALLLGCGFAALGLGQAGEAREFARRGIELSRTVGDRVYLLGNEAILGLLDLALGDFAAAAARLRPLTDQLWGVGRRPSFQGIATDTVEALIGTGELGEAASLLAEVGSRYTDPVTAAATARCRGLLAAARGSLDDAVVELTRALEQQDRMTPQPVERGRTLMALGGVWRRLKQRRAARETLGEAIATLEGADAAPWVARARSELGRVSGRVPRPGELSATELQVAELIAQGMSNRAAAAELFVTVRTIESTLTKIYSKLGLQSRTQLASHLRNRG